MKARNDLFQMLLSLGVICLVSAGVLSYVHAKTHPVIVEQEEKASQSAMYYVLPDAVKFEPGKGCDYYIGKDDKGNVVGYVFKTSEKGYSSEIVLMVGVDPDLKITGIKVLSQNETPGLGTRIVEVKATSTIWDVASGKAKEKPGRPWFLEQFVGKDLVGLVEVKTISGATISSSAVIRAVKKGLERLEECLSN